LVAGSPKVLAAHPVKPVQRAVAAARRELKVLQPKERAVRRGDQQPPSALHALSLVAHAPF
jgi:hypothetical protein